MVDIKKRCNVRCKCEFYHAYKVWAELLISDLVLKGPMLNLVIFMYKLCFILLFFFKAKKELSMK